MVRGQMKIMQMAFMIIGVVIFFVIVGLFLLTIGVGNIREGAEDLMREEAIASLEVVSGMSELNYDERESLTLDEDKLWVLARGMGEKYADFWPVVSLEVYKVYPGFDSVIECPAANCNYYNIYDSGQGNVEKYSSYVSICKRVKEGGSAYDRCEIGKIVAGVKLAGSSE